MDGVVVGGSPINHKNAGGWNTYLNNKIAKPIKLSNRFQLLATLGDTDDGSSMHSLDPIALDDVIRQGPIDVHTFPITNKNDLFLKIYL